MLIHFNIKIESTLLKLAKEKCTMSYECKSDGDNNITCRYDVLLLYIKIYLLLHITLLVILI